MSGSTANLIFKNDSLIVVANCGDSQTFLFRQGVATELSKLHKPEIITERNCIKQHGGQLKRASRAAKQAGPLRVYNSQGLIPGLAVSRSFGDTIGEDCGITALP
jgi:serine/threonine protein phosphatase PrpC